MKEFIDKLIGSLEEQKGTESDYSSIEGKKLVRHWNNCVDVCKEIVNQLAEEYKGGWIPCNKELPPHSDDLLLIQCSGKPKNNIIFDNAFCLASYTEEGWILEMYPEWKDAEVKAWCELPPPYTEGE